MTSGLILGAGDDAAHVVSYLVTSRGLQPEIKNPTSLFETCLVVALLWLALPA